MSDTKIDNILIIKNRQVRIESISRPPECLGISIAAGNGDDMVRYAPGDTYIISGEYVDDGTKFVEIFGIQEWKNIQEEQIKE